MPLDTVITSKDLFSSSLLSPAGGTRLSQNLPPPWRLLYYLLAIRPTRLSGYSVVTNAYLAFLLKASSSARLLIAHPCFRKS